MSIETNKALVRHYTELYSTGDMAIADKVLAPNFIDYTHPGRGPGPEPVKQEVAAFRAAFSNVQSTVEQMIAEGNMVAFRFVLRATHTGVYAGFPPTGKEIVLTGMDFIRIVDNKMVELWSSQDTFSFVQQLGLKFFLP